MPDACVGHEDVDHRYPLQGGGEVGIARDVQPQRVSLATGFPDERHGRPRRLLVDIGGPYKGTSTGKGQGDGLSDAGSGTSDESGLRSERERHGTIEPNPPRVHPQIFSGT